MRLPVLTAVLAFVLLSSAHAAASPTVERDPFSFTLPHTWSVLTQEETADFWTFNFHNSNAEVIQFAVRKALRPALMIKAKANLKKGMGKDQTANGWRLLSSRVTTIAPFGEVDEEVFVSTGGDLTSVTYHVYGAHNIALFTFTLKGDKPNIAEIVRPLLKGFKWK